MLATWRYLILSCLLSAKWRKWGQTPPLVHGQNWGQKPPLEGDAKLLRKGLSVDPNRGHERTFTESRKMTPEFAAALNAKLQGYRAWAASHPVAVGRLVMYEGVQFMSAIDVPHDELEDEVEGLFHAGYCVDWSEHLNRIYLVAWEEAGPALPWAQVYAETDLVDIEALLASRDQP